MFDDDPDLLADARYAHEAHTAGTAWPTIAAELRCSTDHARRLAERYRTHLQADLDRQNLSLF